MIARVLLGLWFIYSGAVKIFGSGLDRFTRDIANYQLVGPPLDAIAAYTVPWFEIFAGTCLWLAILRRGAILTLAGLVLVFCVCIGWAWIQQLDISCGCHGSDAPIRYWNSPPITSCSPGSGGRKSKHTHGAAPVLLIPRDREVWLTR